VSFLIYTTKKDGKKLTLRHFSGNLLQIRQFGEVMVDYSTSLLYLYSKTIVLLDLFLWWAGMSR